MPSFQRLLAGFTRSEAGVATVDWVLLCSAATGAAILALDLGQDNLGGYTQDIRNEMQEPLFETTWTETMEIKPEDVWTGDFDTDGSDIIAPGAVGVPGPDPGTDPSDNPDSDPVNPSPDPGTSPGPDPDPVAGGGSGPVVPGAPVIGCPSTNFLGPPFITTGLQISNSQGSDLLIDVDAGGATNLQGCTGLNSAIAGYGGNQAFFNANPTFSLYLSGMDAVDQLEIETNGISCDTVLLIRDPLGRWHFDDDGGPGLESRIEFDDDDFTMAEFNGRVDVWVGTYLGNDCSFEMEIDTEA